MSLVVILVATIMTSASPALAQCYQAESCYQNNIFKSTFAEVGGSQGSVSLTEDQLNQHCKLWPTVKSCMTYNWARCLDRARLQGYHDLFDYLCGSGNAGYMKYFKCYNSNDMTSKVSMKTKEYVKERDELMGSMQNGTIKPSDLNKEICKKLNEYLDAVNGLVYFACGSEAQEIYQKMRRSALEPNTDRMSCALLDYTPPSPAGAATQVRVVAPLLALAVLNALFR